MRALIIAALLLAVSAAPSSASATTPTHEQLFADFKTRYNKQYETPHEEARRFAIFSSNMRRAAAASEQNPLATFGASKFADSTKEEFNRRNGFKKDRAQHEQQLKTMLGVDASGSSNITQVMPSCSYVDWRLKGVVTPVKNQGECGGCWSFSATGNMESQWALAGHPLTSLSEQELLSCDTKDTGCDGGEMDWSWDYMLTHTNGTIATSAVYPFKSAAGNSFSCPSDFKNYEVGASIIGWRNLPTSESHMANFLCSEGPLSIAVDANDIELYTGGIMTKCARNDINHAILIVGHDLAYSTPYWIIKNSWGADWGEDGYFRVEYGLNLCGIDSYPMTAVMK